MFLGEHYSEGTAELGSALPHGVLYLEQGEPLEAIYDDFFGAPIFLDGGAISSPDHKYTVTSGGQVVAHHRY